MGRFETVRGYLDEVWDGSGDTPGGLGRVGGISVRTGTGRGTLSEVRDGSGYLGEVRDWSGSLEEVLDG